MDSIKLGAALVLAMFAGCVVAQGEQRYEMCVDDEGRLIAGAPIPPKACDIIKRTRADAFRDEKTRQERDAARHKEAEERRQQKAEREQQEAAEFKERERAQIEEARNQPTGPLTREEFDMLMSRADHCIAAWDKQIARQNAIGRETGVVDRQVLYQAGSSKVQCRELRAELLACKARGCPRRNYFVPGY